VAAVADGLGVQKLRPPRAEVVDDLHLVAVGDQAVDHVRPDEPRATGDEDSHAPRRVRNQSMVRRSPSSVSTRGSQPSSARARVMSGWRTLGSSSGSGPNTISLVEPVTRTMRLARSSNVISCGLPMLTGSLTGASISRPMPSTRSSMYWKDRVCDPSPNTVSGPPPTPWVTNAGTARPALARMRGPNVLKIRTIRVSTPWYR